MYIITYTPVDGLDRYDAVRILDVDRVKKQTKRW